MPLRDHFRAPLEDLASWEGFHGQWPAMIVQQLSARLPPGYSAEPRVHLGSAFEIDVAGYESEHVATGMGTGSNGESSAPEWVPLRPTLLLESELPAPPEYEVLVYDVRRRRRLVAAVEIVSPANKDRPENRHAFVQKCESLLRQNVCVSIIDLVTTRTSNLYRELAEAIGAAEPLLAAKPLYAVTCRSRSADEKWRVEAWEHELKLGQPLPTLPIWLSEDAFVPLELEDSYEATCRVLRII